MIEQAKITYSPLGKTFEKQIKAIEDQGERQKQFKTKKKLKQSRKMVIVIKIVHWSQSKKKFNKLVELVFNKAWINN